MGDVLYYKVRATYAQSLTVPGAGAIYQDVIPPTQINNMAVLGALFTEAPGLRTIAGSFLRYRISGVTVRHTVWPAGNVGDVPIYVYTNAGTEPSDVPVPSISTTQEQRWSKSRLVNIPSAGGKPTTISTYYSVAKTEGPDSIVRNDEDYTGTTNAAGGPSTWGGALRGPYFRTGIYTMTGGNMPAGQANTVKTDLVIHLKFFERRILAQ